MALRFLAKWDRLLFVTGLNDGCVTVFVQKNGQISSLQKKWYLYFDRNPMKAFISSSNLNNLLRFIVSSKTLNIFFKGAVVFYQSTLSHFLGGNCRYYPSCSCYAKEAFETYPISEALNLVLKRVLSCHPLSQKSFYDPVPNSYKKLSNNLSHRGLCEHAK